MNGIWSFTSVGRFTLIAGMSKNLGYSRNFILKPLWNHQGVGEYDPLIQSLFQKKITSEYEGLPKNIFFGDAEEMEV